MDPQLALLRSDTFVVVALLIAVLGGVSIATIPVDIFPCIDIPVVSVVWPYHGLTREEMEPDRYKLPASAHVHREADSRRSSSRVPSRGASGVSGLGRAPRVLRTTGHNCWTAAIRILGTRTPEWR